MSFIWFVHPCAVDLPSWKNWIGNAVVSLSLVSLIFFWWNYLRKLSRENIINYLEDKIERKYIKAGFVSEGELMDIIDLGERSEAGYEKEVVIKAISRLIKKIQDSERYSGGDLESILRNFDRVVASKDKPGNETDFQLAVDILEDIVARLSSRNLSISGDEILAYNVLKEIGRKAVELKLSRVVLKIVTIASSNPDALFEIGLSAFKSGDYFAALAALSKLETLALAASPLESAEFNDLLGLLAHFWTVNKSSHRRAESFFNAYGGNLSFLDQYLDLAIEYHYNSARYETADKMIFMRDAIMETMQED
jgi:hypothetical protein